MSTRRPFPSLTWSLAAAPLCFTLAFGCGASSAPASTPGPGSAAAGMANLPVRPSDAGSQAATSGRAGQDGLIGVQPVQPPDDCNQIEIEFAPRVPSVFVLVDRSSSMFERSLWKPLKDGVLAVIQQLQTEVRFGFSSYTGAQGMTCPELTTVVPIGERNYDAIKRAYDGIAMPQFKGETPTSLALTEVTQLLQREPADSPKYILLVTDGEPDFCNDPNVTCARDAVVAAAQAAYAKGIGTFIFSIGGQVDRGHVGDVANAGVGQPVVDRQMAVHYQCPDSQATYSETSGDAPFFEPDVNDQNALLSALKSAIAGARSCVFDLQGRLKVDLAFADQGLVELDGVRVAYGGADGYRMNTETQLELLGGACQRLKQPQTQRVSINFPCKAIDLL